MEVADGMHVGQSQGAGNMSRDAGALSECVMNTLMTPDRTAIQVPSFG